MKKKDLVAIGFSIFLIIVISLDERCSICLETFLCENNEILKLNECTHIFHKDCISKWTANNKTCPICRNSIT